MRLRGKLTEPEFSEVTKMSRPKMFWLKVIIRNWYGLLLICLVLVGTVSSLFGKAKPDWRTIAILWAFIAAIICAIVYGNKRADRRQFSKLNLRLPDWITLGDEGVKSDGPDGATTLLPWRSFKGWREGEGMVLVDRSQGQTYVILPTGDVPETERNTLRGYLRSHIQTASELLQPE